MRRYAELGAGSIPVPISMTRFLQPDSGLGGEGTVDLAPLSPNYVLTRSVTMILMTAG